MLLTIKNNGLKEQKTNLHKINYKITCLLLSQDKQVLMKHIRVDNYIPIVCYHNKPDLSTVLCLVALAVRSV